MFDLAGLHPPPTGVKQARAALRREGLLPERSSAQGTESVAASGSVSPLRRVLSRLGSSGGAPASALELSHVWHEIRNGPAILRGIDLRVKAGERVVLMGRNGAGKSTLLRHGAGLLEPTRGSVACGGRVALLLQNPGDYFLHERVEDEASGAELARVGLSELAGRHPRDLSGGQRQRLALAIVMGGFEPPAVLALDEPTRGMDREAKRLLAVRLRTLAGEGIAVILATHDAEFAAEFATRAVLLAEGRVIADGPIAEILAGGWYFATETARILDGAQGALRPEQGAELLRGIAAARLAATLDRPREAHL